MFALLIAIFPIGAFLLAPLESRYPARPELPEITGIVVLGGGEASDKAARWGGAELNNAAERFTAAMALARRFPQARVVFSGGSGALRDLGTESDLQASIAAHLFVNLGLSPDRLTLEPASRNTAENASYSHALIGPTSEETWVLVTSAFHMPRAMRSFRRAGWPEMIAWPVDYRTAHWRDGIGWDPAGNLDQLNIAIKEHIGLIAYGQSNR